MLERVKASLQDFRLYQGLRFAWHFATDRTFRADHVIRVRRPPNLFQFRSLTLPDRYPVLFAFVQQQLESVASPRLLSFGCATGEEVFSLRRYFPRATIKGVDINPVNIATCRAKLAASGDPGIAFARQESAAGEEAASYDAIFCLAVFQHYDLRDPAFRSCERHIRFEAFEATLGGLARCLKPGGFLALRHMNFRFADTACSRDFRVALRLEPKGAPHPRFDRGNRRLPSERDTDVIFQKRSPAG